MKINIKKHYTEDSTVINTDTYDRLQFEQMVNAASKLEETVERLAKENLSNIPLMGDIWSSLYKMKPVLKKSLINEQRENRQHPDVLEQLLIQESLDTTSSETINEAILSRMLKDENYLKMHSTTRLDEFASSLGSMRLSEIINDWNEEQRKQDESYNNQMNQLKQLQKQNHSNNVAMDKRKEKGHSPTKKQIEKQSQLGQQIKKLQQELADKIGQKLDNGAISNLIQAAAEQTKNEQQDVCSLLGGAGSGDRELKKLPLGEQLQLANILRENTNVKKIAEWAGKLKNIARKKQKSKHNDSVDRSGMTIGNEIERLLPQELGLFKNPNSRLDFLRRYAEGQTMMYSPKGKEVLNKGPIVVCLDESGSMSLMINEAKGFSLALAMIAKKQNRDFCVIPFSTKPGEKIVCEKGKVTTSDILQLANNFLSGGTTYMPVLNNALEYIQSQKRFKNADIIFVTDGDPSDVGAIQKDMDEFLTLKKKHSINIMSLLIGDEPSDFYAKKFSDLVIRSKDFNSDAAVDIFKI